MDSDLNAKIRRFDPGTPNRTAEVTGRVSPAEDSGRITKQAAFHCLPHLSCIFIIFLSFL